MWSLQHIEMYRESRELTHALLQCMAALATDGIEITHLSNRSSRCVRTFLAAPSDMHRLWSESMASPFRLLDVERAAFAVSRRPRALVFPNDVAGLETLNYLLRGFVLAAQRAASVDPRLCALFYGVSLREAKIIRSLSSIDLMQMVHQIRIRLDEAQVQRLQQLVPRLRLTQAQALGVTLSVVGCGLATPGTVSDATPGAAAQDQSPPTRRARKIRVRSDEIRACLESQSDRVGALAHLHEKGLKRPALQSLRGVTKAELMLSGVGTKIPQDHGRLKMAGTGALKTLEWNQRAFAQYALLLIQMYRALDPWARRDIGLDPWAFAVASDLLGAVRRQHPLSRFHEDQILRAYSAGGVETVRCPFHQLEYLIPGGDADVRIHSVCPRCELAQATAHHADASHGARADKAA
jgi:hypothetical protein